MKKNLFLILLTVFVVAIVFPEKASGLIGIAGFTLKNLTIYTVGMLLIANDFATGRLAKIKIPGFKYLVIFLLWTVLSLLYVDKFSDFNVDLLVNARKAKTLVFEPILLFFMAFAFVDSKASARRMMILLVTFLGAINLLSIVSSFAGLNLFSATEFYAEKGRFTGLVGNPNKTAYLLCLLIPFQYYIIKTDKSHYLKKLLLGLILFEGLAIVLSGSRGGELALISEILFISYITNSVKKMLGLLIVIAPVLLMALIYFKSDMLAESLNRLDVLLSGSLEDASSSRFLIWRALMDAYTETWSGMIVGIGFGTVEQIGTGIRAHDMYLEILLEYGIIGLTLFLLFIRRVYKDVKRMTSSENNLLRNIVMLSCAVVLWAWIYTTLIGVLELICLSIGVAVAYLQFENKDSSTPVENDQTPKETMGNNRILSYKT